MQPDDRLHLADVICLNKGAAEVKCCFHHVFLLFKRAESFIIFPLLT